MRKVIVGCFVSLDGVMQAPGGPEEDTTGGFEHGGWVFPYWDDAADKTMSGLFAQPYDLLLGRRTYDIFAAYWPGKQDEIGKSFDAVTKYVASKAGVDLTWDKSVRLADGVADVRRLKEGDGPALLTQGSSVLVQSLLAAGLVDEMCLLTFPITLGKGKKLFGDDASAAAYDLTSHTISSKGVMIGAYRKAGAVPTGSFVEEG